MGDPAHPQRRVPRDPGRLGPLRGQRRQRRATCEIHRQRFSEGNFSARERCCCGGGGGGFLKDYCSERIGSTRHARGRLPRGPGQVRCATRRCPATTAGTRTSRPPRRSGPELIPRRVPRVDRRPDRQQRLRQRRPRRRTRRARTCSPVRSRSRAPQPGDLLVVDILDLGPPCRRRSATRPARAGATPASSPRSTAVASSPTTSRRVQGDLGLPRPERHLAPHPGRQLHRHHPPRPVRHRAVGGAAGRVEPARAGADRHRPRPGAAAGAAAARGQTLAGHAERRRRSSGSRREGARTVPGARERRQPRHQELHPRQPRSTTRCTSTGAKLSGGDLHFSQGDGEITFCGAIEMGGFIDFGVDLIKGGMEKYGVTTNPIFMPGRVEPRYSRVPDLHRRLRGRETGDELLPRRDGRLPARLPQRDRVPEEVRLHGRAGLPAAGLGADRGPRLRRGRHPQRLLLAVPADGDLRLRHPPERGRAAARRPRRRRRSRAECRSTPSPARAAATSS